MAAAKKVTKEKQTAHHCWDAIARIYAAAGFYDKSASNRKFFQYITSPFNFHKKKDSIWGPYGQPSQAMIPEDMYGTLQLGDWLYVHNRNTLDNYGNHSALFMGWKDKERRIIHSAECLNGGKPIKLYDNRSLHKAPVVGILRPRPGTIVQEFDYKYK